MRSGGRLERESDRGSDVEGRGGGEGANGKEAADEDESKEHKDEH